MLRRIGRLIFRVLPLWSWRVGVSGTLGAMLLVGAAILGLRYWLLPNIDSYRPDLERVMSSALGQKITIGALQADWRGLRPQFTLLGVTVYDQAGRPALELERIDNSLAWSSLFFLEPRFHTFEIHRPQLFVRRAPDGTVWIAGIALRKDPDGGGLADWVLRQKGLSITRAAVSWLDEQRGAPELRLEQVSLRLQNDFYRHRFGLQAVGPAGMLGRIDARGDFVGSSLRDLSRWEGQLYLRLDQADLAAYKQWVDLPISIARGQGALRMWVDVAGERVTAVTADVHLAAVAARLGADLAPLEVEELSGRVGWRAWPSGFEVFTRGLSAVRADEGSFGPIEFNLRRHDAQGTRPERGEMRANALDLGALAHFAEHLPIDPAIRSTLVRYAPQGHVTGLSAKWTGSWPPSQYEVRGRFERLGIAAVGSAPGFSNVSGIVEANENRGTMTLANRDMRLELPRAFAEALHFDTLAGQISWTVNGGRYDIRSSGLSFANADVEGSLQGSYHTTGEGLGSADLTGTLVRADARRVARYLPLIVGESTREWVRTSVLAGHSDDVQWRLKGELADFPFERPGKGHFEVVAKARDGILEYATGWPRIENLGAEIRFIGNRLEVKSTSGSILGVQLSGVQAVIPDLITPHEILEVTGQAEGPTAEFMRFIDASPVAQMIERFLDGMEAQGRGRLALKLTLPLRELAQSRVAGSYRFVANRLRVDTALPPLENVDGQLEFTESSVQGRNITAQIFGGPATIAVDTRDGVVVVNASGRAAVEALRKTADSALLRSFSGAADWHGTLQVRSKVAEFVIESGLEGVASSLPPPFAKAPNEALPLRVERRASGAQQDTILVKWGRNVVANVERRRQGPDLVVERAAIGIGTEPPEPEAAGIWLRASLPALDGDRWRAFLAQGSVPGAPTLAAADIKLGTLDLFGRRFNDVTIAARRAEQWRMQIAARELDGDVTYHVQDKGQIVARLQRLILPTPLERAASPAEPAAQDKPAPATEYPALDVVVEDFSYQARALGRLQLNAVPAGRDWRIERLELRNADATLTAHGVWQWQAQVPHTRMKLELKVADIGKFLKRMRYPEGVRGGTATLAGTLGWDGAPQDIDFPTLSGELTIDAARGQFVKLDPGIGKLLSILSLQALPRRVTLDFKDVFSEGFAFDTIHGPVTVRNGIASTKDFRIIGSSARVAMTGDVDLTRETQSLRVRVTPSIGDSVATVTALLGGPVAGIGVFLAQKLLNDPLGQLIAYDYAVTGTWSDPAVSKIGFERSGPG